MRMIEKEAASCVCSWSMLQSIVCLLVCFCNRLHAFVEYGLPFPSFFFCGLDVALRILAEVCLHFRLLGLSGGIFHARRLFLLLISEELRFVVVVLCTQHAMCEINETRQAKVS